MPTDPATRVATGARRGRTARERSPDERRRRSTRRRRTTSLESSTCNEIVYVVYRICTKGHLECTGLRSCTAVCAAARSARARSADRGVHDR